MPALNASDLTTPHPTSSSLLHDALYQLMREGLLGHTIRWEDGMTALSAWWVCQGVRLFGNPASDPAQQRPVLWAPGHEG